MSLRVTAVGPSALVQDLGRPGHAALGVTGSGAADRAAAALANRCVGNDAAAAVLEIMLGGLELVTDAPAVVALTGAPAGVVVAVPDGTVRRAGVGDVLRLPAGGRLGVETPASGLRTYLAVRGGIDVPPVLGSRSRDTLARLGPEPLAVGDVLPVGRATAGPWSDGWVAGAVAGCPGPDEPVELDVLPGPRDDWFDPSAWGVLAAGCVVGGDSDRVGTRLETTAPLRRVVSDELPSEGAVRGAVQVPADGRPVIFGPDHPVTGGYPVLGVLTGRSADAVAQLRPGCRVRLRRSAGHPGP